MPVVGDRVRYGDQFGYLALPLYARAPVPGVVLIHDLLGLDGFDEDLARRIAAAGYAVLAPDLFAVDGQRPPALQRDRIVEAMSFLGSQPATVLADEAARQKALDGLPEEDRLRVMETIREVFAFRAPSRLLSLVGPLRLAVAHLRHERDETRGQRVASVGEGLSALLACQEPELSAAVVLYGTTPPTELVAKVRCPVLAFYGSRDTSVNAGIPAFADGMRAAGKPFESHVYEGAGHGFFNDCQPRFFDLDSSRDAFARMLTFLLTAIGSTRAGIEKD
ncbi:MAG: dienelactone hydrolase family protein [Candidatus Limnocylindrales bacterium]